MAFWGARRLAYLEVAKQMHFKNSEKNSFVGALTTPNNCHI